VGYIEHIEVGKMKCPDCKKEILKENMYGKICDRCHARKEISKRMRRK